MPIEELKVGMRVWSRAGSGELKLTSVVQLHTRKVRIHLRVELEDGRILEVTPAHPFFDPLLGHYRKVGSFKRGEAFWQVAFHEGPSATLWPRVANRLQWLLAPMERAVLPNPPVGFLALADPAGDSLATGVEPTLGRPILIRSMAVVSGEVEVFNLTVGGPHTYFAEGVLVHNK